MTVESIQFYRVRSWFAQEGDKTFRMDYALNEQSVVLDVGGYHGEFAQAIFDRYGCNVYVFEPHPEYAAGISDRFADNPKVRVFSFGLGENDGWERFGTDGDATSSFRELDGSLAVNAEVRSVQAVLRDLNLSHVDLMKINVEGAEYGIIDTLHAAGMIGWIDNYQVQFHDFVPEAASRLKRAQTLLLKTHSPTYLFSFVWENWRKRKLGEETAVQETLFAGIDQLRETLSIREREIDRLKDEVAELSTAFRKLLSHGPELARAYDTVPQPMSAAGSPADGVAALFAPESEYLPYERVDEEWYALAYPDAVLDVQEGRYPSLQRHYDLVGLGQCRMPRRPVFDAVWYADLYPDVAQAVADGIFASGEEHFLICGAVDGRIPSQPVLDEEFYFRLYPDIEKEVNAGRLASGMAHYLEYGFKERRLPNSTSIPFVISE